MKIKLSGYDRLIIPEIIPEKGGRLDMILRKEIEEIIEIKSVEFKDFELIQLGNNQVQYNIDKIKLEKEFDLKKPHTDFLKECVKNLDEAKMWTAKNTETCLKIEKMR